MREELGDDDKYDPNVFYNIFKEPGLKMISIQVIHWLLSPLGQKNIFVKEYSTWYDQ